MKVTYASKENNITNNSYAKSETMKSSSVNSNNSNSTKVDGVETDKNEETKKYTKKDLENSVVKLNKFLEDEPVHAEYSIHKDLHAVMIKIVEDESKKVILEIPSEKILDMVASMCKQVGLLDKKA